MQIPPPKTRLPISEAIANMRKRLVFKIGHLSPKPSGLAIREFENAAFSEDLEYLKENIRMAAGYSISEDGSILSLQGIKEQHRLIEETFQMVELSYKDLKRKDGKPAVLHPYQVGGINAPIHMPETSKDRIPFIEVVGGLTHDIFEDISELPGFALRIRKNSHLQVCKTREQATTLLGDLYSGWKLFGYQVFGGHYAREIIKDLNMLTRNSNSRKYEDYRSYLHKVCQAIRPMVIKAGDNKSNQMSVWTIKDKETREGVRERLVGKSLPLMLNLKKVSFVLFEILLSGFDRIVAGTEFKGIDKELRSPTDADFSTFKAGYKAINVKRTYSYDLLSQLPSSGTPSLIFFTGGPKLEVAVPFCSINQATLLLKQGFGEASRIRLERKIIPFRLDREYIFSISNARGDVTREIRRTAGIYTEMLHDGLVLPSLRGFDRALRAKEAEKYWKGMAASKRLQGFSFYKM
jgi:hypothetical protein